MKILYKTKIGSHLFGTFTENSDIDYVGIYLPAIEDLVTGDVEHVINRDTNKLNVKNTKDDVDYKIISLHHWLKLLSTGETNAVDILFSIFREDTIEYIDKDFKEYFTKNYKNFLVSNAASFIGYSNSQAKKYSLKIERYDTLTQVIKYLSSFDKNLKIAELLKYKDIVNSFNYTEMVQAAGPRKTEDCWYLEILGRKYSEFNTIGSTLDRLRGIEISYCNRAKYSETDVEWKSLSHAVRIIDEIKELLATGFIKFPLKNKEYVLNVKTGKVPLDTVLQYVENSIEEVEALLKNTKLPKKFDYREVVKHFYFK